MRFFRRGSRVAKSSLPDRISILWSIDTTFLHAFSSTNQSKSSIVVIRFEISIASSCPPEDIDFCHQWLVLVCLWLHTDQIGFRACRTICCTPDEAQKSFLHRMVIIRFKTMFFLKRKQPHSRKDYSRTLGSQGNFTVLSDHFSRSRTE
jgi:hypothetical protein